MLTERYLSALELAFKLHQTQIRKGSQVPYFTHLMSVSAMVLENGGSEDQAIAALLHDAVEDQGGKKTLNIIKKRFGADVAEIVEGCSDSDTIPKPPWKNRKLAYLEKIKHASDTIKLVSLADKIHNARSILQDLQTRGEATWSMFTGGKDGSLWYYKSLVKIFDNSPFPFLKQELHQLVDEIIKLADPMEQTG
jgi:(p)ppGpp synthase/HD superfamily hydrolase